MMKASTEFGPTSQPPSAQNFLPRVRSRTARVAPELGDPLAAVDRAPKPWIRGGRNFDGDAPRWQSRDVGHGTRFVGEDNNWNYSSYWRYLSIVY